MNAKDEAELVRKALCPYIGRVNNDGTRGAMIKALEEAGVQPGADLKVRSCTSQWENTPWWKRLWLWVFGRRRMRDLKGKLELDVVWNVQRPLYEIEFTVRAPQDHDKAPG